MTQWLKQINLDWDEILHWAPEMFICLIASMIGMGIWMWMRAAPFIPNWVPALFVPPITCGIVWVGYVLQTDNSRMPNWVTDPDMVRPWIACGLGCFAGFMMLPFLVSIARRWSKRRTDDTTQWTREGPVKPGDSGRD